MLLLFSDVTLILLGAFVESQTLQTFLIKTVELLKKLFLRTVMYINIITSYFVVTKQY